MEIIEIIFRYFWYELFFVLLGIVLVYHSRVKFYPYTPRNISDSVPEDFETYFQFSEEAFFDLDWIRLGTFHCTHPKEQTVIIARFYCSPDYNHAAMLAQCIPSEGDALYLTEFYSELSPCGSILTNNNPYPDSLAHPNDKFVFKFPSISYVNILHAYHLDFCQVAQSKSFTLKKFKPECLEDYLYYVFKRDYEYQVKKGRMKRVGENAYSWTLCGAVLAAPKQAIHLLYGSLFSFYRPKQEKMIKRMKRRLAKIKQ